MQRIASLTLLLVALGFRPEAHAQSAISGIEVEIQTESTDPGSKTLEIHVRNKGDKPVYVMVAPKRSNDDMRPYLQADPHDPNTLLVEYRLFAAPRYPIAGNHTSIAISRVNPGGGITDDPTFKIPLERTEPPYGAAPLKLTTFPNHFQFMKAVVGVLPDLPALDKMSEMNRGFNWYTGNEPVDLGNGKTKTLLELQQLFTSRVDLFAVE